LLAYLSQPKRLRLGVIAIWAELKGLASWCRQEGGQGALSGRNRQGSVETIPRNARSSVCSWALGEPETER